MKILYNFILLFVCLQSYSQNSPEFFRLGVNEGLSQNSVYGIHQDKLGFLWIGTGDGLNRYDGKKVTIYRGKYNDTSARSLRARIILGNIIEDSSERLWFGSNNGLVMMEKQQNLFHNISKYNSNVKMWNADARVLAADSRGKIWIALTNSKLHILNPDDWTTREVKIPNYTEGKGGEGCLINDLLYFTTLEGLFVYDDTRSSSVKLLDISTPLSLRQISATSIALHTKNGYFIYDVVSKKLRSFQLPDNRFSNSFLKCPIIQEYPENIFYLNATPLGIVRYDAISKNITLLANESSNPSSLSSNLILTSFVDRSKNLWLGTEGGGLSRIDLKPKKFKSFPAFSVNSNAASNLMVKSVIVLKDNILAGTFSKGLYVIDSTGSTFRVFRFPEMESRTSPASINLLHRAANGEIWMNVGHGIGRLDTINFTIKDFKLLHPLKNQITGNFSVYSMAEYSPGKFLLGSNYTIHRMTVNEKGYSVYNEESDTILNGHVQNITPSPDGYLYIGKVRDGFRKIKMNGDKITVTDSGFFNTGIRHFHFEKKQPIVWMAGEDGLIAYNTSTKKYRVYDEQDGMANSYIYSILPESDSSFWMSTNKGLCKANVRLIENGFPELTFNSYTQLNGLQSNEFNSGAFFRTTDGEMVFGGVNGVNWFHPSQIISNTYRPSLSITDILVNEVPYSSAVAMNYLKEIRLPHDSNTISFRFAALEFTNPQGNEFAYMLQGVDKDWIFSHNSNEARYSNIAPGNYTFKVKASNSDGLWSEEPLSFSVIIDPPFWQTWWFRLLTVVVFIAVLALIARAYIQARINKRIREIEKQTAINDERVRISKDMHDELGTGLTRISLLTAVSRQAPVENKRPVLDEIYATSRKLTEKMGEIIWTLSPQNDTLDSLAAYLKEYFFETTDALSLKTTTDFPEKFPEIKLSHPQRQQILMVTKEALNNAIKHARGSLISFSMKMNNDDIRFEMKDNGSGFIKSNEAISRNGKKNGLGNMAWRMQQVNGYFNVETSDKGTAVIYGITV